MRMRARQRYMIRILAIDSESCMCMRAISEHACVRIYSDSVQNFIVLRAYMVITRGSGRPACEEAAADAGYASGTWRRAASLSGHAGAGGRTDVELLIALSDDTPGLRDCGAFQLVCEGCSS